METEVAAKAGGSEQGGPVKERPAVAFLVPTFKTPMLTSDLLHAAVSCGTFKKCSFILLLQKEDPSLLAYREIVEKVRGDGLDTGYIVFDGTPYAGMVNRIAPFVDADSVCVLDSRHLPVAKDNADIGDTVRTFLAGSPQQMQTVIFNENGFFPIVTKKLIERLGYMFHPLAYGRIDAENWILNLSAAIGVLRQVPDGLVVESSADGVEIMGASDDNDVRWVDETLEQALEDEAKRLQSYLLM